MSQVYQRYPAMRYHKGLAPEGRAVTSAADEAALGPDWVKTPAAFEPGYVEVPEPEEGTPRETIIASTQPYIPYPAMRYTRDGQECTVQTEAEDRALDPRVWKPTPDPAAWANEPPSALDPASALTPALPAVNPLAASLYLLNAAESQRLIDGADTAEKLAMIEDAEVAHPKHEGGRVSVLRAIEERREQLMAKATA